MKITGDDNGINGYNNVCSLNKSLAHKSKMEIAQLWKIYQEMKDENIISELKQIISDKNDPDFRRPIAMEVLSNIYIFDKNEKEAILLNDVLIKDNKGTTHEKNGLLNLFFIYYDGVDFVNAENALMQIDQSYSTEERVMLAKWLLNKVDLGKSSMKNVSQPLEYNLFQNYPNPFNPTTTINYLIKEEGFVTLKLYDILGAEIKTLVNEEKTRGRYTYNFDGSGLTTGVYIYQLRINNFISSKKLLLVK